MTVTDYYKRIIAENRKSGIEELLRIATLQKNAEIANRLYMLSSEFNTLQTQIENGIVSDNEVRIASNQITYRLLALVDEYAADLPLPKPDISNVIPTDNVAQKKSAFRIGNSVLNIEIGDITTLVTEAFVSSDDTHLSMKGGVSGAIANKAGEAYIRETQKHVPISLGGVCVSGAGLLDARYVFHVATLDAHTQTAAPVSMLPVAVRRCLSLAEMLGVRSIAFPAIGSGAADMADDLVARTLTNAICQYLQQTTTGIHTVFISLYGREGYVTDTNIAQLYSNARSAAANVWTK